VGRRDTFISTEAAIRGGSAMIQVSTGVFVAAPILMGSFLAFAWFMLNSAINRIVLLEVRVEMLEKALGSNRFDH
jgi:hypothetical protein